MAKRIQSLTSDNDASVSPERDVRQGLFDALREARLNRQLSQEELARTLGLRQRQISDLERATMDSRTSFSNAHSFTRCVPLRPSTIDNAVPHAPAPMTAMSLMEFQFRAALSI